MKRILFIEDEIIPVKRLIEKLKKNYDVQVVGNGNSALNCLDQNQYDLILIDIMLPHGKGEGIPAHIRPKQTGITILKKIRNRKTRNSPHIPIIVMTALSDVSDLEEIKMFKPRRLFQKPKELSVIYEAIVEAIEMQ